MNDKTKEILEMYLAEAVPLDNWGQWSSWGSRVAKFLEKALGTDAASEFESLSGNEPFDTFGMQRGHIEGLIALDNGPSRSVDQKALSIEGKRASPISANTRRIFVVHGHDGEVKETLARFLEKLGLAPVILHEQPNQGRTIIEKFEVSSSDVAFAVVLLTPDDLGCASAKDTELRPRARQNVILELGYFMGRLGRMRVCVLHKGGIELPSDYQGVVYIELDSAGAWRTKLAQEFVEAKLPIDLQGLLGT
jgi:predicted nucleotide-binding protein